MNKTTKIIYFISTGLLTALMLFSASMYFAKTAEVQEVFESLGYPGSIVIPLAIAKILGLVAIWTNKSRILKLLAYGGFAVDLIMAIFAHINADDQGFAGAAFGLVLVATSFITYWKMSKQNKVNAAA